MTETAPLAASGGTRLVRFLRELIPSDGELSQVHFTERLGKLIDLPTAITLSSAHRSGSTKDFEARATSSEVVNAQFLRARSAMVQAVVESFNAGEERSRIRLPEPDTALESEPRAAFEPYQRFYLAHQREIVYNSRRLHSQVREALSGMSPELAQMAELDSVFNDALSTYSRQCFAVIPKLLGLRFRQLLDECSPEPPAQLGDQSQGLLVHQQFSAEMQELLLAEIEARLLPVLGLLEAINETSDEVKI